MFSNSSLLQTATTIVFIDASVSDYQTLQTGVVEGVETVILSPNQDGIEQISQILQQYPQITTIHIVSHGAPGCLYLGNSQLNLTNINNYAQQLQHWPSSRILLYGCNVAAGDAGEEFISKLHQITGTQIAASTQRIGNVALGGTWELEAVNSQTKIPLAFRTETLNTYQGIFAPTLVGNYDTSGNAYYVQVVGKYAYVADDLSGLQIIDISNPTTPTLKGNYDTSGFACGVQVVGNYAYVTDGYSGLQIIDISNPTTPTLKGNYRNSGRDWRVQVIGNYAYVAYLELGLQIIDISNPTTPTLKGNYATSGQAYTVQVVGNYAYVADGYSGLQIIDISNPTTPTLKGNYDTSNFAIGVQVVGNYAYVADNISGLQIIDISDPTTPTLKGNYDTSGAAYGVQVVGNYAYVADYNSGLQIIDISNPTTPTLKGNYDTSGLAYNVQVVGNYAYVADMGSGLQIIDVSEFTNKAPTNLALSNSTVAENQVIGTVVGNFTSTDPDTANTFTYSLVTGTGDTDNSLFTITNNQLSTKAVFDFETKNSYNIRVKTTDQDGLSSEKQLTIGVSNVNETPTNLTLSNSTIAENQAIGTAISNFTTTDPDANNTFTYSLVSGTGDTDNALFTIVNGQLKTNATFDYETQNSYSIRVRATDTTNFSYEKELTIGITNVNESPSFNVRGIVTTNLSNGPDLGESVIVQPDGKIVVAGITQTSGNNYDFALVRYNNDGTLDITFDSDGKVTTNISGSDFGYSTILQPDGKILVAGRTIGGDIGDFAVVRYNSDGSLDTTFDSDGKVTTNFDWWDYAYSVTLQPDGKILVAGFTQKGDNSGDFALVRYNSNGSLDTTFDSDGKVTTSISNGNDVGKSITLQTDGKILVAGQSNSLDIALVRYNSNGSLDTTFNGDGKVITSIGTYGSGGYSVTVQPDGKILVAGSTSNNGYNSGDIALVRYNSNGSLDTTFDGDGKVITSIGSYYSVGQSLTLQQDGKILVAGTTYNGSSYDLAVVRYNSNGSLDTTFDTDGKVTTYLSSYQGGGYDIALQPNGKIVVTGSVGYIRNGLFKDDIAVVRYNSDGSLDTTFGVPINTLNNNPVFRENSTPVILDNNITISDPELDAINNWNGAKLTLARSGGANGQDIFSNTGTLGSLAQGSSLTVNGTNIGIVTTNSNGTLLLNFNNNATSTLIKQAIQQITYANSSDAPLSSVTLNYTLDDGNTGLQETGGALTANGAITVNITAVNDAPTNLALSNNNINENQAIGTLIGNLSSTDPDANNTFTYSLISGTGDTDNALFSLSNNQLKTNAVFDYEAKNSYSIRVKTTDQGGLFFDKQFTIGVNNVNETPTNITLSNLNIAENQLIGTVVGNLTSTDPDTGNTFTYSLVTGTGATDNSLFTITNNQLTTNSVFDYETKNSYSIRVKTTDQGGLSYEKQLTIGVTDVNETPTTVTRIIDVNEYAAAPGFGEIDTLQGATGSDRFILGNSTKIFYDDGNTTTAGTSDYALIKNFNVNEDIIQLSGLKTDYTLNTTYSSGNTAVYRNKPNGEPAELIAIIQGVTGLNLNSNVFASPDVFNAAKDFTLVSNPNGAWRYGYSSSLTGSLTLYTYNDQLAIPNVSAWNQRLDTSTNPNVFYNGTATTQVYDAWGGDVILPSYTTAFHPGPSEEYSFYRWIAPSSGLWNVNASFVGRDTRPTTTDVHVLVSGISKFDAYINDTINTKTFTNSFLVSAGDTIDFAVGWGSNAEYSYDTTGIDATISLVNNETPTNLLLDTSTIAENQPINTVIGNLNTTDRDTGNTFTYSLVTGTGATDNSLFSITNNQLSTKAVFDFETKNSYSIRVKTTDQGGLSFEKQLTIGVTDVNETPITLAVSPSSVQEDGTTNLVYIFTRTGVTTSALTVNYTITGTADSSDYTQTGATTFTATSGTITFVANSPTATLTIDPIADTIVESDETVVVTLAAGTDYTVGTTTAVTGTITNDDFPTITLAVAPSSVFEDGTTNLVYTFTRTGSTTNILTVNYSIAGTADSSDYTGATPGTGKTITFAAGETTKQITIDSTADTTVENDETVVLNLATGTGYNIATPAAVTGTIANDDTSIALAVSPSSVLEDGKTNLVYTFTRTGVTNTAITVNYGVAGTATFNNDYTQTGATSFTATGGTINFAAGETTKQITIDPKADTIVESDETVALTLLAGTGYNNIATPAAVTRTIANDDTSIALAVSLSSVLENGTTNLVYTFTRTGVTNTAITVNYGVAGTATFNNDYTQTGGTSFTAIGGTINFAAGETTEQITIDPTADTIVESDETVALTLLAGTGYNNIATLGAVIGTILNDEFPIINLSADQTILEGDTNPQNVTYTVTLSTTSTQTISVNYATANGTATAGLDYTSTNGTLTFAPGITTQTINIPIFNDNLNEADETFILTLTSPTNVNLGTKTSATTTITDTLTSSVTTTLPAGVENLTLTGTAAINGTGNDSNNILTGNSADNTLTASAGNDTLTGGNGVDTVDYSQLATSITLQAQGTVNKGALGTDTVQAEVFIGNTAFANVIDAASSTNNPINADLSQNSLKVFGLPSGDVTFTVVNFQNITGSQGSDTITGNNLDNNLNGSGGDDILIASVGNDILTGGDGVDTVDYSQLATNITLQAQGFVNKGVLGTDIVQAEVFIGNTAFANVIDAASSIDNPINADLSENSLKVFGLPSGDVTFTVVNFQDVTGSQADDIITGNGAANNLNGSAGDDILIASVGNDALIGGDGVDIVDYGQLATKITLQAQGFVNKGVLGTDTVQAEVFIGNSDFANVIDAASSTNNSINADLSENSLTVFGLPSGDVTFTVVNFQDVTGSQVDDIIAGNDLDNTLNGGAGADVLSGSTGNDSYYVDNAGDIVKENANEGTDSVFTTISYTLASNLENLTLLGTSAIKATGNGLNNSLTGNNAANTINGGIGNDTLNGRGGNDILLGGVGADDLTGDIGNDLIYLGANDNAVDTVRYTAGHGIDTIYQFVRGIGGDKLNFTGIANFDVRKLGANTEIRIGDGIGGNTGFGNGQLLVTLSGTSGFTSANANINLFGGAFLFN